MYTSANKPHQSFFFFFLVHHIEAALLSPTFGCAVDIITHPKQHEKVH